MELQNCTGTKFKDTCDVGCDKEFNRTVSYVQCGSDGKWTTLTGGKPVSIQQNTSQRGKSFLNEICLVCTGRWEC